MEASFASTVNELRRRIEAEPGVVAVTFVDRLPRTAHTDYHIELYDDSAVGAQSPDGAGSDSRLPLHEVDVARIDPSCSDVPAASILAGHASDPSDHGIGAKVAIVEQGFVEPVLQGRNPIWQRRSLPR